MSLTVFAQNVAAVTSLPTLAFSGAASIYMGRKLWKKGCLTKPFGIAAQALGFSGLAIAANHASKGSCGEIAGNALTGIGNLASKGWNGLTGIVSNVSIAGSGMYNQTADVLAPISTKMAEYPPLYWAATGSTLIYGAKKMYSGGRKTRFAWGAALSLLVNNMTSGAIIGSAMQGVEWMGGKAAEGITSLMPSRRSYSHYDSTEYTTQEIVQLVGSVMAIGGIITAQAGASWGSQKVLNIGLSLILLGSGGAALASL